MNSEDYSSAGASAWVDHIPVLWFQPQVPSPQRKLILFLPNFTGTKERTTPFLRDIAAAGFVALSFDPWQHGERSVESQEAMVTRVFGNFRRNMWPIIGQTTLDTLRVIDWAFDTLDVAPRVYMGGVSMGGDISVAAAGVDHRIERVAAVVATPDWLRPGMHDAFNPEVVMPAGEPDAYAQYFYESLNPLTHLNAFSHGPAINFICGEKDTHVPPDGALRFQSALRDVSQGVADQVQVHLIPGMTHMDVRTPGLWWPDCLAWLTAPPA